MDRNSLEAGIVERISEGVLLVGNDGVIHYANAVIEHTLGFARGALHGVHAASLTFLARDAFDQLLQQAFDRAAGHEAAVMDLEARRHDGSMLPLQVRVSSLDLGAARYVIAMFSDLAGRRQIERELLQVATRVQQRVGGDLHEDLGQQLSGIAMMVQGLAARAAAGSTVVAGAELDQIVALLNAAVRRTRLLARGLSPVGPSARSVREGFEELVNHVHEVYGQRVQLALDLPAGSTVDEHCATALFHIAREAVENAARHARASDIRIHFSAAGPELELQVVDDGVGFDPALAARAGLGLRMMRFRAEMARGFLSIESRPGDGVRLRCRVPQGWSKDAEFRAEGRAARIDSR